MDSEASKMLTLKERKGSILPIPNEGKDVYNPSVPFIYQDKVILIARVEERISEQGSLSVYYERNNHGIWEKIESAPLYEMQDPFIAKVKGLYILGGVAVDWQGLRERTFRTELMVGADPFNLEHLATGPLGMKCIRLVELSDGRVGICTRPQGGEYGLGKIGYLSVDDLNHLKHTDLQKAFLLPDLFGRRMWGGINQLFCLENGNLGGIGHRAWFTDDGTERIYEAIALEFDPETLEAEMKIIAKRANFPQTPAKRPDLKNVFYPSGIYWDNGWRLIGGLSDTSIGEIEIDYPFSSPIYTP